jgi:DNA polymerase
MLNLSLQPWPGRNVGWMPAPYRYYGAHTGRFSGDHGYNFANLRRGSPIRDAIWAPPGYRVVHRDSSQIECRVLAWLAGEQDLLDAFRQGRDVYSEFASKFYDRRITKQDALERFVGKTSVLGLGYGCGHVKFRHVLYVGNGGVSVALDEAKARTLVELYRETYKAVPMLWRRADRVLKRMIDRGPTGDHKYTFPCLEVEDEALRLPNGMWLRYPGIRNQIVETTEAGEKSEIVYDSPRRNGDTNTKRIYGCKLVENVSQALARIIITDVMLRVRAETGFRPFMSTYDSHDYCVPESEVENFDRTLEAEFTVTPSWMPGLPLASEGGWGNTLLEAERGVNQ